MRIEAIAIGTELLTTSRVDTNSIWIAQELASLGLAFHRKTAVGDDREAMKALFREALDRSDLILCTGGLGPTFDDFTKELWAEVLGVELREDAAARATLLAFFESRGRTPSPTNFRQVLIPVGAEPIPNPVGTAPGVWWESPAGFPGKRIVLMPGVPREMKRMFTEQVAPRLAPLAARSVKTLRVLVSGVPESVVDERTKALRERHGALDWTILASLMQVELIARGTDAAALEAARKELEAELGEDRARTGDGSLEEVVLDLLADRGQTLVLAESMTGGLAAARLAAIPGASRALKGGAVVYSAEAKAELAGLDPAFIQAHGTVSEAVTRALAERMRAKLGATWGLAVTGNAGPGEDPAGPAPVGTTFIALAGAGGTRCERPVQAGDRADMQLRAVMYALDLLRREVLRGL
ncbi:MAG TPA: CinA family nicotinamide mononucleotide deamidase-related protein [Holophagaceae bacterium]|nr:CinA family nicotinamide mononucleotide deamidase-related protein [Holophagaceae bacterium]